MVKGKRFVKEYANHIKEHNRTYHDEKSDKIIEMINRVLDFYSRGFITEFEAMRELVYLDSKELQIETWYLK